LNTLGAVLLHRPVHGDDVARVMPFLPASLTRALIDDNVAHGIVDDDGGLLRLTHAGHVVADAVVQLQEDAVSALWTARPEALAAGNTALAAIVTYGTTIDPPTEPATFTLFAVAVDRPTSSGRVLRAITALRYWRADAHRAALDAAGLVPRDAHALN